MGFDAAITDASGNLDLREQTKATVRGESESTNVADGVANKFAKQFSASKEIGRQKVSYGQSNSEQS